MIRFWPLLAFLAVLAVACTEGNAPAPVATSASGEEEQAEGLVRATATPAPGRASVPRLVPEPGRLDVYFFDVSLGDAIYIRTPANLDVVIDGGESDDELSAFLDTLGETEIDVLIASHPHADHIGGLARVIRERKVGAVWTNGQPYTTTLFKDLEEAIASAGVPKNAGAPGTTFMLGEVKFSILAPSRIRSNVNDNSLVVRMDCGTSSFLFTGDAETSAENDMIGSRQELDVDVLKLGHHGSRTSSSRQMILASTPRLAVYSALEGNEYGHPHTETLERLRAENVATFGTRDAGGTVVVSIACDDQFSVTPKLGGFATIATGPKP
ncbi:MAG TPA: MBL fold metallo-hydrolase [Dehalococcoidia bacterium]|nr:MBL fold metallo-hydrolase [Dehalococcoidia bacterium]